MTSNTFCPLPWNHLAIQQNGDLRQCCQMIASPFGKFFNDDGEAERFDADKIDEIRNHESIKSVRAAMLRGDRPESCNLCWTEEDSGIHSKRMSMITQYYSDGLVEDATLPDGTIDVEKIPLAYMDLRLGNLCNLKCRTCGPSDSSLWVGDHAKLTQKDDKAVLNYYNSHMYDIVKSGGTWKIDSDHFDWHKDQKFHTWLDTQIRTGLNRIYFTGGEPTVNTHHMKILKRIIELGRSRHITLEYNSNMVAIPPQLLDLWKNFNRINVGASIDAMGDLATYIRHPGRWNDVEKNCDAIGYNQIPQIGSSITSTISVLNVRHFLDLSKWLLTKKYTNIQSWPSWHVLHRPEYLNIQILPTHIKTQIEQEYEDFYTWYSENINAKDGRAIKEYYSGIIRFMWKEDLSIHLPKLKHFTASLDRIRGESLELQLPWLNSIIKDI